MPMGSTWLQAGPRARLPPERKTRATLLRHSNSLEPEIVHVWSSSRVHVRGTALPGKVRVPVRVPSVAVG